MRVLAVRLFEPAAHLCGRHNQVGCLAGAAGRTGDKQMMSAVAEAVAVMILTGAIGDLNDNGDGYQAKKKTWLIWW